MSIEQRIKETHEELIGMNSAATVKKWADENPWSVLRYSAAFNNLIRRTNKLLITDNVSRDSMPYLSRLQKTLKGEEVPTIGDFSTEDFLAGLNAASGPVLLGQRIKKAEVSPTSSNKQEAILTTSNDLPPNVLAAALIGHLIERTVFARLKKFGCEPDEGWSKDDILKAFDEVLLLDKVGKSDKEHPLWHLFRTHSDEGGLGWISDEMEEVFRENYAV